VEDETDLDRWQSGVFYADGTPKASFPAVRDAVAEARRHTSPDATGVAPRTICRALPVAASSPPLIGARSGR
jgi:hypothetical protein